MSNDEASEHSGVRSEHSDQKGVLVREEYASFSGPLPPPDVLRKFDEIVPGAAERIIKMAEQQFAHRTELEKKVITSDIAQSSRGQILGFIIAVVGLVVAGFISVYGNQWAGGLIGLGTLASLVGVFMYGVQVRSNERKEKAKKELDQS
jgi:uncharacterized membrane protein